MRFENAVVVEALKHGFNQGHRPNLSFFRDSRGLECDLLYPHGDGSAAIEIKSGATVAPDWFNSLERVAQVAPRVTRQAVVWEAPSGERERREKLSRWPD